jgi:hypothetical protein
MIAAGSVSVIAAAANNSRNRAAGSAENEAFSAIPIRSWIEREVGLRGAFDDIMSLLRFGYEKESLLVATLCRDCPLPVLNRENSLSLSFFSTVPAHESIERSAIGR